MRASTNVLLIRNCRHALGELASSRRTLHMLQRAAGGRRGRRLECLSSYQISDSVSRCKFT